MSKRKTKHSQKPLERLDKMFEGQAKKQESEQVRAAAKAISDKWFAQYQSQVRSLGWWERAYKEQFLSERRPVEKPKVEQVRADYTIKLLVYPEDAHRLVHLLPCNVTRRTDGAYRERFLEEINIYLDYYSRTYDFTRGHAIVEIVSSGAPYKFYEPHSALILRVVFDDAIPTGKFFFDKTKDQGILGPWYKQREAVWEARYQRV